VRAKMFDPETMKDDTPSDIVADQATLDFSAPTVTFHIHNDNPEGPQGGRIEFSPKPEKPKKESPKKDNK